MSKFFRIIICLSMLMLVPGCGSSVSNQGASSGSGPNTDISASEIGDGSVVVDVDPAYSITRDVYGLTKYVVYSSVHDFEDIELDSRGRIVSARCSKVPATYTFEYNDNDQLTKCVADHGSMYGIETAEIKYNDAGEVGEVLYRKVKDGNVEDSRESVFEYDENGLLKAINGSKSSVFEYDDQNRMIKREIYFDTELIETDTYSYSDGVNPAQRQEISYGSKKDYIYTMDISYDERGNVVLEDVVDDEGETSQNIYTYSNIGTVTESPETNPVLAGRDKWEYFDEGKTIPVPSTCILNIEKISDDTYKMPSSKGTFFCLNMKYVQWFQPEFVDGERAYVALDRYLRILEEVCGCKLIFDGLSYDVLKNDKKIANVGMTLNDSDGYILTVKMAG